jgi:hypothetical protein
MAAGLELGPRWRGCNKGTDWIVICDLVLLFAGFGCCEVIDGFCHGGLWIDDDDCGVVMAAA